jgi:hypothetical protein
MQYDYDLVASVDAEVFDRYRVPDDVLARHYIVSDHDDVRKIERLLDAQEGSLDAGGPYYLKAGQCACCGKSLTMYDFVFTALVDANHPKSFVYQILVGDKKIIQSPRRVRCATCGTPSSQKAQYFMGQYACDDNT